MKNTLGFLFSFIFIGLSMYQEHFAHNIPMATLDIGWACLAYLTTRKSA